MGERGDPGCNRMPPGLLAIEIEGGAVGRLAIRRANNRSIRLILYSY
jgi:hypothetical protein